MLERRCLYRELLILASWNRNGSFGMRRLVKVLFWFIPAVLAVSLVMTIVGSSTNHSGLLNAGIIGWLASSAFIFVWLVLFIGTRTRRYAD
jgi:hypothetical protein